MLEPEKESLMVAINRLPKQENMRRGERTTSEQLKLIRYVHAKIREIAEEKEVDVLEKNKIESGNSADHRPNYFQEMENLRNNAPSIETPQAVSYQNFSENPFFPVVAKNTNAGHGKAKYLLETSEQLEKFRQWVEQKGQKDAVSAHWIFQEYVETPSEHPTSYRVLVDWTGEPVASGLLYGPPASENRKIIFKDRFPWQRGVPEIELEDPKSPHFLDARSIASNRMFALRTQGVREDIMMDAKTDELLVDSKTRERIFSQVGGRIVIDGGQEAHKISEMEAGILKAHGLDTKAPQLPAQISEQSSAIAKALGRNGNVVEHLWFGIDFIQGEDGNFYLLEVNRRPNLAVLRDLYGGCDRMSEREAISMMIRHSVRKAAKG